MKNKKIIIIFIPIILLIIALSFVGYNYYKNHTNDNKNTEMKEEKHAIKMIFDNVLDAGTYKKVDYNVASEFNKKLYDNWGGCTAIAKNIGDNTIIGRNMDLTVSDKSAYVFKTNIKGKYKTLNLAYTYRDYAPDYADAINGLEDKFYNILPFISDDVLNEKGLYIEVNMRNGEEDKFSCSGTNPDSNEKVYMFSLPIYIGLNCSTVEEALEYVKSLNIYSKKGYWNYAFMIADSTGRHGILEFAQNKILWNEGENAQANFYINEEMSKINELKAGVGRYNYVKEHIDEVNNKEDMFNLMDKVKYSGTYVNNPNFDVRSEFVGVKENWTYDYVMDEANQNEINEYLNKIRQFIETATREDKKKMEAWESSFTEVIDIKERTIKVRFFEDENKIYTLSFNN